MHPDLKITTLGLFKCKKDEVKILIRVFLIIEFLRHLENILHIYTFILRKKSF